MTARKPILRAPLLMLELQRQEKTNVDILSLACRFCAWLQVRAMQNLSTRDLIDLMQEGFPGFDDEQDVERELEDIETDDFHAWLREQVTEFLR